MYISFSNFRFYTNHKCLARVTVREGEEEAAHT